MDNLLINDNYGLTNDNLYNDKSMLHFVVDNIVRDMKPYLKANQLVKLNNALMEVFNKYEAMPLIEELTITNVKEHNNRLIGQFIRAKSLEGLSPRSIEIYESTISKLVNYLVKPIEEINADDMRDYLKYRQDEGNCGNKTLDNIRRYLSAVFTWFFDEGLILKNPMFKIEKIKTEKTVKKPLSDWDVEKLRMELVKQGNIRNILIFEFLLSTGVRISELVNLNRSDIDLNNYSCIVLGKGGKERKVYFNVRTGIYIEEYLNTRQDNNPALIVSFKKPHNRLSISGMERMLRELGNSIGVNNVHPHRFRRTFATNMIRKGVPIVEVQKLLGHEKLDTTMIYAKVDDEQVKFNHKRLTD